MDDQKLLSARSLKERYDGASDMWLHRRLKEDDFPRPVILGGRRFWRLKDLEAYELASIAKRTVRPTAGQNAAARAAARQTRAAAQPQAAE